VVGKVHGGEGLSRYGMERVCVHYITFQVLRVFVWESVGGSVLCDGLSFFRSRSSVLKD